MKKLLSVILILLPVFALAQNKDIDSLKKALSTAKADTTKAMIYHKLAFELAGMDPDAARKMSDKSFAISKKINYQQGIAYAYWFRSIMGSYTGNFPALKANADTCLAIATKYNFQPIMASAHNSLGVFYWQTGNYSASLKNHLSALKIRERLNDEEGISKSLGNIGQVYLDNGQFKEAESYTLRCLATAKKMQNSYVIVASLHVMANICSGQKQYGRALKYDEEALTICLRENNKRGLSQVYSNMAHCYNYMHQYDKALKYHFNVLALDEFFGDKKQMSDTYLNIGEVYKDMGKYADAKTWLKKSLAYSTETQYKHGQQDAWKFLSEVYEKEANYKDALLAHQKYQSLTTDIVNEDNNKQIALLQTQYETQKKEQQISLLNKENTIQKLSITSRNKTIVFIIGFIILAGIVGILYYNRQKLQQKALAQQQKIEQQSQLTQAIIDAEEKERRRIASDLHDGVGQLFSAVKMNLSGLLDRVTINREEDRFLAEKTIALVDESCKEVRVISHQMMPNMLLRSGIASDVKSFIEKIDSERLKVNVEATGFKNKLESNVEIVLYRVIQESVNNVIKHSKATTLDIKLTREGTGIEAIIADNGVGFNTALKDDFEGIGLKNIATRIEYLKGSVLYTSAPGMGTSVKIWVPVA
ncbi:MAG: sensor histidine kinase [Mucilaginibacter sp.]|nr:sensor histidine kinase [Mucilaginibacter sp.]